ncbi:MAG: carbon-nitrogen hydrolase family protein [Saprospiraceae bacterium]|nr:carbon-nitrogen hydrolase family protein [Saprospiraceae bacterium]
MKEAKIKIAVIQHKPTFLNLEASLQKAEQYIIEAASEGAQLIAFGETWLCGYPSWLDYCPEMGMWDHEPTKQVFQQMHENGVEVGEEVTKKLGGLARENQVIIGIGVNEVVRRGANQGTIFNSFLLFNQQGELVIHHRKLMPTYTEKLLYGTGDGFGLRTAQTPFGNIGGLICWEHWMPLTRQAIHLAGEHIHLALWPKVHEMHQVASRHYAFEGRCFVIAIGQILQVKDLPSVLKLPEDLQNQPEHYLLNGGSCVVAPNGKYLLEPQFDREAILYVDISDLMQTYRERMTLDVTGHYNRKDIFSFEVNNSVKSRI